MEDKFHAVIDTNVIVSAVISKNLEATINGWTNLNNEVVIYLLSIYSQIRTFIEFGNKDTANT